MIPNYVVWLRSHIGQQKFIMTSAAACIRDSQGRVLLQKRADNALWGFPGGSQELAESIADTVRREVKEEVGLDVEPKQLIGLYTSPALDKTHPNGDQTQLFITFFECEVRGGELQMQADEVLELGWFELQHLPKMQPCCALKAADAKVFQGQAFFR